MHGRWCPSEPTCRGMPRRALAGPTLPLLMIAWLGMSAVASAGAAHAAAASGEATEWRQAGFDVEAEPPPHRPYQPNGCNDTHLAVHATNALSKSVVQLLDDRTYLTTSPENGAYQDSFAAMVASNAFARTDSVMPGTGGAARSKSLLSSLVDCQWLNGMVPSGLYLDRSNPKAAFPPSDMWKCSNFTQLQSSGCNLDTTGLMAPPYLATAVLTNYYTYGVNTNEDVLQNLYSELFGFHQYIMEKRTIDGLVYIIHPWESGLPSLASWNAILNDTVAANCSLPETPRNVSIRADFPGPHVYNQSLCLIQCIVKHCYDLDAIRTHCGFVVQSVVVNSLFVQASRDLLTIAQFLDRSKAEQHQISEWITSVANAMRAKLYSQTDSFMLDRLPMGTPKSRQPQLVLPLSGANIAGLLASSDPATVNPQPSWQDGMLFTALSTSEFFGEYMFSTIARSSPLFRPSFAMSGPIWLRVNFWALLALQQNSFVGVDMKLVNVTGQMLCLASEESTSEFPEAFNADTGDVLPNSHSVMSSALWVLLLTPPAPVIQPPAVPLTIVGLIWFMSMEVLFVLAVGIACVVFSCVSIRRIRQYERGPVVSDPYARSLEVRSMEAMGQLAAGRTPGSPFTPLLADHSSPAGNELRNSADSSPHQVLSLEDTMATPGFTASSNDADHMSDMDLEDQPGTPTPQGEQRGFLSRLWG